MTQVLLAWFMGARFDVAFDEVRKTFAQITSGEILLNMGKNRTTGSETGHREL